MPPVSVEGGQHLSFACCQVPPQASETLGGARRQTAQSSQVVSCKDCVNGIGVFPRDPELPRSHVARREGNLWPSHPVFSWSSFLFPCPKYRKGLFEREFHCWKKISQTVWKIPNYSSCFGHGLRFTHFLVQDPGGGRGHSKPTLPPTPNRPTPPVYPRPSVWPDYQGRAWAGCSLSHWPWRPPTHGPASLVMWLDWGPEGCFRYRRGPPFPEES